MEELRVPDQGLQEVLESQLTHERNLESILRKYQ